MASSGPALDDFSRNDLLEAAGVFASEQRTAEVNLLRVASRWAHANGRNTVDPEGEKRPGRPSMRLYGGSGTPYVASVAGADLGARIGRSTYAGDAWMADALDLEFRLPQINARVQAGEVQVSYARFVARRTRELEPAAAAYVDSRVAESADGRISWSRFEWLVEASVRAADPEAAAAKEKAAREQQFARVTRSSEDGMRGFYLRTGVVGVARLDATVAYLAEALHRLGCTEDVDTRRAMAMVILASPAEATRLLAQYAAWKARPVELDDDPINNVPAADVAGDGPGVEGDLAEPDGPADRCEGVVGDALDLWRSSGGGALLGECPVIDWSKLLPALTLYVHLYGGRVSAADIEGQTGWPPRPLAMGLDRADSPEIVRVEGIGALTATWLRVHLGLQPAQKVNLRPVLDLEGQAPVDAWEIPDRHREAVRLMTPADVFPFGSASANQPDGWRSMQIDHTVPWQPAGRGGQTGVGNYGPLTAFHHNLKTHGGWQVQQPFAGIFVWRDPHGALYLVDHTGTRALGRTS
jgi:hypothetical protein